VFTVKIDTTRVQRSLEKYLVDFRLAVEASVREALVVAESTAKAAISAQTKSRTGRLLSDVQTIISGRGGGDSPELFSSFRGRLKFRAPYAGYIDSGTRPHIIRAKDGGVLSFELGGKRIFARSVKHPGTHPRPFVKPASEAGLATLEASLRTRIAAIRL